MFLDRNGFEVLVTAVSDGAGSASRSDRGATLVVNSFIESMKAAVEHDDSDLAFLDRAYVVRWLQDARIKLTELALDEGFPVREYASTFIGAVIGNGSGCYAQIGDGAIVVVDEEDGDPSYIFWPQHGEFANSTFFVTHEEAQAILLFERQEFETSNASIREIALFTDGLERLILDFKARAVHGPALKSIFTWLSGVGQIDPIECNHALTAYLNSPHVNRRTDDDKTLVVAKRVLLGSRESFQ